MILRKETAWLILTLLKMMCIQVEATMLRMMQEKEEQTQLIKML